MMVNLWCGFDISGLKSGIKELDFDNINLEVFTPIFGWPEAIINIGFVTCTLTFILTYVKRMITLGFLIVIAPLITITYAM